MEKENLILIHSFPTNSILLSGLIEYLNDYFNVYFIDLPGFTQEVPPLAEISLEGYYSFVKNKLKEFNLESYVAGGVSFGFLIMNNIEHDRARCKGIIGMMPYFGPHSLRMSPIKRVLYATFIKGVCLLRAWDVVWGSNILRTYLPKLRNYPPGAIDIMMDQIDGRTFFQTANLLLNDRGGHKFQDLPYVLLASKEDRTVNYDYLYKAFTENAEELLAVSIEEMEHYPKEPTKEYFKQKVPEDVVKRVIAFISEC